ncbi:hypothetical protein MC885_007591 [Smutsia gigantea]|nr:hypothetical protein MC885_007591 [Smutsia gigantea]
MAEQGRGKGCPSSALTLPAQPPASWKTSERTFVWAAKLNLPPSCQGIGKAVRGKKGEKGEGAPGSLRLPGRRSLNSGHPGRGRTPRLQGHKPGARRPRTSPRERSSLGVPLEGRVSEARRGRELE